MTKFYSTRPATFCLAAIQPQWLNQLDSLAYEKPESAPLVRFLCFCWLPSVSLNYRSANRTNGSNNTGFYREVQWSNIQDNEPFGTDKVSLPPCMWCPPSPGLDIGKTLEATWFWWAIKVAGRRSHFVSHQTTSLLVTES